MVGLGDLPGGSFQSVAEHLSADGSLVVGYSHSALGKEEAFRWASASGMVSLGDLPGGIFQSDPKAVSADGSIVVGNSTSASGFEAFRWTAGGGMVGLGDLPDGVFSSTAEGISADGSVIVGAGNLDLESFTTAEAFRWTAATGIVGLGDLPGGAVLSAADDVSADGSVVVGDSISASGFEAFRWTAGGGMVGLGDLPEGIFDSHAWGVSGDGSVIVGNGTTALGPEAFIWTEGGGMQNLRELLIAGGATGPTGWRLIEASAVSADGRTIVGIGRNPAGNLEAWMARLENVVALAGDFNVDGSVDAADYVVWRKELGTTYAQNDYDTWRANFGNRAPAAAGSGATAYRPGASAEPRSSAAPEPTSLVSCGVVTLCLIIRSRRRQSVRID
jgi:probable HAF family extracellular repeat protein